jgi:predicted PurR-regulated permease PerM
MRSYVLSQIILCVIAGVAVGVGLSVLGVRYSLVLGVLAGITRAVPIVGPVFSAIPITLLSLSISVNTGISVLVFFCILHLLESKVLLPELLGDPVEH